MSKAAELESLQFPFATELVTNRRGQIAKVVLSLQDYRALLGALRDCQDGQIPLRRR